ncbi:THUMP domain-containing protein 3 isoform X2 [Cephus cinctus]|nr:THUMP domain-containing protein 3 isoform X2 [Cephus cinctus]
MAVDEYKEKLGSNAQYVKERGRIYFNLRQKDFSKVQDMRSIDNVYIVADASWLPFSGIMKGSELDSDLEIIRKFAKEKISLRRALDAWKEIVNFHGIMYPSLREYQDSDLALQRPKSPVHCARTKKRGLDPSSASKESLLRFRVTCERTGSHSFESQDVARIVGGELQDTFNWIVDLVQYHLQIVCHVKLGEIITSLRVTHESKHRRNIQFYGPTTLRSTICYSLIRLASPLPGDIIIDPMCGGGSIPLEAAIAFPNTYLLGGEIHCNAVDRARANVAAMNVDRKLDLIQWNLLHLPLKDSFVDIFVTDMPFGKRSGSITDNRVFYKKWLLEMGRVSKLGSGRLVLLTKDRRSIATALKMYGKLFRVTKTLGANIGGLQAAVYVLLRTNISWEDHKTVEHDAKRVKVQE